MNKKMFIILFVYYFYFVYSATESLKTIKMEEYTKDKETTSAKGAICMNMKKMKSGDNNLYIFFASDGYTFDKNSVRYKYENTCPATLSYDSTKYYKATNIFDWFSSMYEYEIKKDNSKTYCIVAYKTTNKLNNNPKITIHFSGSPSKTFYFFIIALIFIIIFLIVCCSIYGCYRCCCHKPDSRQEILFTLGTSDEGRPIIN
jgi:hypothetical protein